MRHHGSRFLIALLAGTFWSTTLATTPGRALPKQAPPIAIKSAPKKVEALPSSSRLAKTKLPKWVKRQPPSSTQTQKSARERGINPCMTPDPGFGRYGKWDRSPSMGQMIVPKQGAVSANGEFDVVIHFHGHEPARKEWVQALDSGVLVGIDLGLGSGPYLKSLAVPGRFEKLLRSIEKGVAKKAGVPKAKARRVALSAWSAGYGAVESVLRTRFGRKRIDSVILLDGLHSGYEGGHVSRTKLAPFADFARRAARGETMMFVSHSSIIPPGYASTTETANYLVWQVGGTPHGAKPRSGDPMGLELLSRYSRGNFHVRGFAGNDTLDHCAHLGLYRDVLTEHLAPRWGLEKHREPQVVASR